MPDVLIERVVVLNEGATPALRRLADAAEQHPTDFLVDVLKRHATIGDAAEAMGVNRLTLYNWCRRMGIRVVTRREVEAAL